MIDACNRWHFSPTGELLDYQPDVSLLELFVVRSELFEQRDYISASRISHLIEAKIQDGEERNRPTVFALHLVKK
jgi:hypothetical protein